MGEDESREGDVGGAVLPPEELEGMIVGSAVIFFVLFVLHPRVNESSAHLVLFFYRKERVLTNNQAARAMTLSIKSIKTMSVFLWRQS